MKIRIGFVSNSSSSSFILWIDPQVDYTFEHIKSIMFGQNNQVQYEYYNSKYDPENERYLDTNVLAQWVFNEFNEALNSKHRFQRLRDIISDYKSLEFERDWKEYEEIWNKYSRIDKKNLTNEQKHELHAQRLAETDAFEKRMRKIAIKKLRKDMKENKGRIPIAISFSDNDGKYGCHLEQSGIIERIFGAKRISHH